MFFNNLFSGVASLSLLTLLIGITIPIFTGSEYGFDLRPALPVVQRVLGQAEYAVDLANGKTEDKAKGKPMIEVVKDSAKAAKQQVQKSTENTSGAKPLVETGQPDGRIAVCPNGSVEPQAAKELPTTQLDAFKIKYDNNQIKSYLEVQKELGPPACNWKSGTVNKWKYIGKQNRIVDVTWTETKVEIKFSGF